MAVTPNKGYTNQVTGTNSGTWGVVLNSNFSIIDDNLGGTLSLSVAGSANVNLTASQAQNLIYNFTGVLTGNIVVTWPQLGGFYFVNNETTGAFSLTVAATNCTGTVTVPQGTQAVIYVDAIGLVLGLIGTSYVFVGGTVGGAANALTISQTYPQNFTLQNGAIVTVTPSTTNTGSATLNVNGTGAIGILKIGATGLVALQAGDLFAGVPVTMQYNGTNWIALSVVYFGNTPITVSTNFSLGFINWLAPINCTAALTMTVPQVSVTFTYFYHTLITAGGGNVTITPYSTDIIWVNGIALSAGVSYILPQGASANFYTDANGNIYLTVFNGVVGVTNGSNAPAGAIGEYISSTILVGSAIFLTANTPTNITSISLTAGDWDVWGNVCISDTAQSQTQVVGWTSSVSATVPTIPNGGAFFQHFFLAGSLVDVAIPVGIQRVSIASTTTFYLSTSVGFTAGTNSAYGFIGARRVR
jgi:hypothetical protein